MEAILAANAYARSAKSTASPRTVEHQVLSNVTRALVQARDLPKSEFATLVRAVHDNTRLWTLLAADVSLESNELPKDLKGRILYLAQFTRTHSGKVLKGEAGLQPLIDINTAVMRGLRGDKGDAP